MVAEWVDTLRLDVWLGPVLVAMPMLYLAVMVYLASALPSRRKAQRDAEARRHAPPSLRASVVVAARNEAARIEACVRALLAQQPAVDEIIVVDDASTDDTLAVVKSLEGEGVPLRVLSAEGRGKKHALDIGVQASTGDVILLTDADCTPPTTWAAAMLACFTEPVGAVLGMERMGEHSPRRLNQLWERIDVMFFTAVMAATATRGRANDACGRNFSYRRDAYNTVGGYAPISHIASGDDTFMVQAIQHQTDWRAAFCFDTGSIVLHPYAASWAQLFQQRARYATTNTTACRSDTFTLLTTIASGPVIGLLMIAPLLAALSLVPPGYVAAMWGVKVIADYVLLLRMAGWSNSVRDVRFTALWSITQPYFIVVAAVMGLIGRFEWKSKQHHRGVHQDAQP